ncbi:MAG: zinc-finger domain-containing protein [Pseudomonadota bacterium]
MQNKEIAYVNTHKVKCEGAALGAGHPLVYLEIKDKEVVCPYCSKTFILKK